MIEVNIGIQGDGTTFRLAPGVKETINAIFPHAEPAGSVYLTYDTQHDFEHYHGPMWGQVALLLTGLTKSQLEQLGGAKFISLPDGQERGRYPQSAA
jgi:hypothetical protein